jgi:Na+/phosphate symporter
MSEKLAALADTVEVVTLLEDVLGRVRQDFEKHRPAYAHEVEHLAEKVRQAIVDAMYMTIRRAEEKSPFTLAVLEVYRSLEHMAVALVKAAQAVKTKATERVLFSDRAVAEMRTCFEEAAGLLVNLRDLLKTGNAVLAAWVGERSQACQGRCQEFATEHEERLVQGICLPRSSTLYLIMLEAFRDFFYWAGRAAAQAG